MSTLVSLNNISFSYSENVIFENTSLSIDTKDIVLINGKSGCGKTTFLKLIYNQLKPNSGERYLCKKNYYEYKKYHFYSYIGYLSQSPDMQLCTTIVEDEIAFGLKNIGVNETRIQKEVDYYLGLLKLESVRKQPTASLSGGQKQKLILASILALKPNIILFDEPTSQLDHTSSQDFVQFLKDINQKTNTAFVICEHKTNLFEPISTKKFTISNRTLNHFNAYPEQFDTLKRLPISNKRVIEAHSISFSIEQTKIIDSISFEIFEGERVALVGDNGSGKSTLIQLLCGILKQNSGTMYISKSFGVIFQNPDLMLIRSQVKKEITDDNIIQYLDLDKEKHPLTLSKGQRLRCAFGSVLCDKPSLILMDEPTTGQDIAHINQIISLLTQKTLLFSTHDKRLVDAIATRVITLQKGKILSDNLV